VGKTLELGAGGIWVTVKFTVLPLAMLAATLVCTMAEMKDAPGVKLAEILPKAVAIPSLSVTLVAVLVSKKNVSAATDPEAVKVTVVLGTGLPLPSVTRTTRGCNVKLLRVSTCPFPETTDIVCADAAEAQIKPATAAAKAIDLSLFKSASYFDA